MYSEFSADLKAYYKLLLGEVNKIIDENQDKQPEQIINEIGNVFDRSVISGQEEK
jgi:hypothetical protein